MDFNGDSKKLHKFVTKITGSKVENPMPSGENDITIAEKFAEHFMYKIGKIRESLKPFKNYECENVENLPEFDEVTFHYLS